MSTEEKQRVSHIVHGWQGTVIQVDHNIGIWVKWDHRNHLIKYTNPSRMMKFLPKGAA